MSLRRVKITGLGFVTPAGIGRQHFWDAILEPRSYSRVLRHLPEEAGTFVGTEVTAFDAPSLLGDLYDRKAARHTLFALGATKLALGDANLTFGQLRATQPAVIIGASLMDFGAINRGIELILKKGPTSALMSSVFSAPITSINGAVSDAIGGTNRTIALQSACCSGLDAVGAAARMIADGECSMAVCGGTEAPLFLHPLLELRLAGLTPGNPQFPERQCRPFDLWRTTGVIGEGACIMILESEESPRPHYAYIEGYAFATDSESVTGSGLTNAIHLALANSRRRPVEVECINAWGPGHRVIDAAECSAIASVFLERSETIPAVSIKGAIGNPLGAAGAIQTGCAALALRHSRLPPTVNWQFRDPECRLNLSNTSRFIDHSVTLINSHGLSGTNSCLVLAR